MSIRSASSGTYLHIGMFGAKGVGRSCLLDALVRDSALALPDVPAASSRVVELPVSGPAVFTIAPEIDGAGAFVGLHSNAAGRVLEQFDAVILVIDFLRGIRKAELAFIEASDEGKVPCAIAYNKADLIGDPKLFEGDGIFSVAVSAAGEVNISKLKSVVEDVLMKPRTRISDILKPSGKAVFAALDDGLTSDKFQAAHRRTGLRGARGT